MRELSLLLVMLSAALVFFTTTAQAQIFQNFFGGQQYEAREQEAPPSGDASWFEARVEAASCTQFLCPRTLSCVSTPAICPCPFPHQIRCPYPNSDNGKMDSGGHVCVQEENCQSVIEARKLGQNFKLSDLKSLS